MRSRQHRIGPFNTLARLFIVSVAVNYFWEVGQGFLFVGMNNWEHMWWHCFVASLGDGVIIWIMHVAGWAVFRRPDWFIDPGVKGYSVMLATGLIIAVTVEWVAVHILHRWAYTADMPIIPGVNIGVVPVLQMLILPPMTFYIVEAWSNRGKDICMND